MQITYIKTNDDEVVLGISKKENPYHRIWKIVDDYKTILKPYDDSKKEFLEKLLSNNCNVRDIIKELEHEAEK